MILSYASLDDATRGAHYVDCLLYWSIAKAFPIDRNILSTEREALLQQGMIDEASHMNDY